jgi:non-heme chloroperoxidase
MEVFDGLRDGTANHPTKFYQNITIPFYGYNRPAAKISQGISFTRISRPSTCRFW